MEPDPTTEETAGSVRTAGKAAAPGSTRALVALLAFVLGFATVPHRVCERGASRWLANDAKTTDALAAGVARWTASTTELAPGSFATGSSRFDGEWLFATYMMGAMGFGQVAEGRPDVRDESLARMERCLDVMLEPRVRAFDDTAWGADALGGLAPGGATDRGHVAYLGYAGLAFALHRSLRPQSRFAAREEAIVAALTRRIEQSPSGFVETYPGEVYPVDNAAAIAALAVHAHAVAPAPATRAALARGLDAMRRAIDPASGLLVQTVRPGAGAAFERGVPRASGTALATYFLAFADPDLSRVLFEALQRKQFRTVLGFGGMMEYPRDQQGATANEGDVDSGPVVLGFGVSASGFSIGASRAHGDRETFTALYATAHLFGAPLDEDGVRTYATGGPIGDAILFAMLTAPRAGRIGR